MALRARDYAAVKKGMEERRTLRVKNCECDVLWRLSRLEGNDGYNLTNTRTVTVLCLKISAQKYLYVLFFVVDAFYKFIMHHGVST